MEPTFAPEESVDRLPRPPLSGEAAQDDFGPPPLEGRDAGTAGSPAPSRFPGRPLRTAAAVALALVLAGAAFLGRSWSPGTASPPDGTASGRPTVAILSLEDRTGDAGLASLGFIAADWVAQGLARTGLVGVIPTSTLIRTQRALSADGADRTLAGEIDAAYVVSGTYYVRGDSVFYEASLVDARDGSIVRAVDPAGSPREAPLEGAEVLRQRVVGALAGLVDPRLAQWARSASAPPGYEAYVSYADGLTAFFEGELARASTRFADASARDPDFTAPVIWRVFAERNQRRMGPADSLVRALEAMRSRLAPWDRAMLDYHAAFHRGDWGSAYRAMERVLEIAPGSEWTFNLAITAQFTGRPARAVELLRSIDPDRGWIRTWSPYWAVLSECLHQLGLHAEELAAVREAARRFPHEPRIGEVIPLAEMGRAGEAETLFDRLAADPGVETHLLERIIHGVRAAGQPDLAARMAERALALRHPSEPQSVEEREEWGGLLRVAGRFEEARVAFESLRQESGRPGSYAGALGLIAAHMGDVEGARRFMAILQANAPGPDSDLHPYERGQNALTRARMAAQMGDAEEAMRHLREAYGLGLTHHSAQRELPEFEGMRSYPPFAELLWADR